MSETAQQPLAMEASPTTAAEADASASGGARSEAAAPAAAAGSAAPGGSAGAATANIAARRRNRTNYRCSKCGQPKRGHICPYQPRILRADGESPPDMKTVATQVEIDERRVVRHLRLDQQGFPESYGEAPPVIPQMFGTTLQPNALQPGPMFGAIPMPQPPPFQPMPPNMPP